MNNSSLSLNSGAYDENDDTEVMEILDTRKTGEDPLDIITKKEYFTVIEKAIDDSLSDFEKKVLIHYKNGESYAEIAEKLQSKVKSVDTAIQIIRKKAMKIPLFSRTLPNRPSSRWRRLTSVRIPRVC